MIHWLKTLRVRFSLWTAGLLLVMSVVFGVFVYFYTAQNLINSVDTSLSLIATQIIAEIDVLDQELVSIETLLTNEDYILAREQGLTFRIVDNAGNTIQANGPYLNLLENQIFNSTNREGQHQTIINTNTQQDVRVYTVAIIEDQAPTGAIQVGKNLTSIQRTLAQLLTSLLIGIPIIVVLAAIGGFSLATRTLKPIDQITHTAQHISIEDLSARLDLPDTNDELGRLAKTFDSMLARLEQAFQRERQFIADASHELRTPLTTMQTILSSTLTKNRSQVQYHQALSDLSQETDRMKNLTEGLLLLARHDNNTPLVHEALDLSILLHEVVDSLQALAQDKDLDLVCVVYKEILIEGRGEDLTRLFTNLVGNAIKYTQHGSITITLVQHTTELVAINITDTGQGIPANHLPYIFDRFYQLDQSRASRGSGLGLAIALSIAQAHHGTIQVESEVGKGTTFTVQLAK